MESQYLDVFLEEANEHIENLNKYLLELENNPSHEIIDEIFRSAHTLKGMSGTMGFVQLAELTHEMENLLQRIRDNEVTVNERVIDILLECVDTLENLIADVQENAEEKQRDIQKIVDKLKSADNMPADIDKADINKGTMTKKAANISNFNEYEGRLINKALEEGLYIWKIVITLNDECLLKSARAFLVFKNLEALGDIMKTIPSVQDIEDEKFDNQFTLYLITPKGKESIIKALETVSELKEVNVSQVKEVSASDKRQHVEKNDTILEKAAAEKQIQSKSGNLRKASKTLRVDIERLDILMNLVSELIIIKTRLEDIDSGSNSAQREAIEYLERITSNLHEAVMKARMVPIANVFNRFPRVIHDLSRELSKKIDLVIEGAETELDRTVIDEIGDPLIHLIRNAADHGIENPQERKSKGKAEKGIIRLKAYHDGNNVVIEVSDDGAGIDKSKVLEKAIEVGLIDREQSKNLKEHEITSFIFEPGFSTADKITDVSGRGVGLDVVKNKIESLGGSIEISSKKDSGTTFQIRLPLTLAIIQALMVKVGDEKYAIPLSSIKETVIVTKDDISKIQKNEVIVLRGNVIPVVRLNQVLDIEYNDEVKPNDLILVIVKKGKKDVALAVDDLIGQQEIVIKTLGSFLKDIKFIAGATILGNGEVALILDTNNLI